MANEGAHANRSLTGDQILAALLGLGASGAAFADDVFAIKGSSDATKLARFEVDGLTTATTRVYTLPDATMVVAGSAAALTSGRVPYATTGGLLTDSAKLTWDEVNSNLTVGDGTSLCSVLYNGAAGTERRFRFQTAGVDRWKLYCTSTAESGSDAGSDLSINARTDAGASIDNPILIVRATGGAITLARPVTISTASSGLTIAKTTGTTLVVSSTTASSSGTTGAFTLAGGMGILGSIFADGGRVVIGPTSQSVCISGTTTTATFFQSQGTSTTTAGMSNVRWSANALGAACVFAKSRGAAVGTHAVVTNNDVLGLVIANGSDGAAFRESAHIRFDVDGSTISSTSMPGRIVFLTTPSGSVTPAEVMRIDAAGLVTLNATNGTGLTIAKTSGTTLVVSSTTAATSTTAASVTLAGGLAVAAGAYFGGNCVWQISGTAPSIAASTVAAFIRCSTASTGCSFTTIAGNTGEGVLWFGDTDTETGSGAIRYAHSTDTLKLQAGGVNAQLALTATAATFASTAPVTFGASALSTHATAGVGYATGAGGTVTQATSKATAVTLSKVCGTITMNAAALAAGATVSFTWTNTAIAATDFIGLRHDSAGTVGAYQVDVTPAAGSATITVTNRSAGSLSEAIVLKFAVVKAVTA